MKAPPQIFRELLERYEQGERDFTQSDLAQDSDNDLSGKCLDGCDFSESFIMATFHKAKPSRGAVSCC
jgi:hypothetical protein